MTLVLVAHGTRDPAGAVVARELADAVADRLAGVRWSWRSPTSGRRT